MAAEFTSDGPDDLDTQPDGAAVLDEVCSILRRYVVFPSPEAADSVTLYAAATYAAGHANFAPRLIIRSPEKRCGKTRLIVDVLGQLVHRPLTAVSLSPAALVHSIDPGDPPTIILDETDTVFGKGGADAERAELLRGVLNSGFTRGVPYVRWDAQARTLDECPTFAMAILGGIDNGKMPDTIEDRAVIITLRRKAAGEEAERFRARRDNPKLIAVADRLHGWAGDRAEELGEATPALPDALGDRAMDVWEPLLAVAELAGGDWPARGRRAALAIAGEAEDDAAGAQRLLPDLRDVFSDHEVLSTQAILDGLHKVEEAPWGSWFGHPLSARDLARLLRPYGVKPRTVKIAGATAKGYHRADLWDTWQRYCPLSGTPSDTSVTSVTAQVNPVTDKKPYPSPPSPVEPGYPGDGNANSSVTHLTSQVTQVTQATDTPRKPDHDAVLPPTQSDETQDREDPTQGQNGQPASPSLLRNRTRARRCEVPGCREHGEATPEGVYCARHAEMMNRPAPPGWDAAK